MNPGPFAIILPFLLFFFSFLFNVGGGKSFSSRNYLFFFFFFFFLSFFFFFFWLHRKLGYHQQAEPKHVTILYHSSDPAPPHHPNSGLTLLLVPENPISTVGPLGWLGRVCIIILKQRILFFFWILFDIYLFFGGGGRGGGWGKRGGNKAFYIHISWVFFFKL